MSRRIALNTRLNMLAASAQFDQSSQGTLWVAKDPQHLQVDSEDSDQTVRGHKLI